MAGDLVAGRLHRTAARDCCASAAATAYAGTGTSRSEKMRRTRQSRPGCRIRKATPCRGHDLGGLRVDDLGAGRLRVWVAVQTAFSPPSSMLITNVTAIRALLGQPEFGGVRSVAEHVARIGLRRPSCPAKPHAQAVNVWARYDTIGLRSSPPDFDLRSAHGIAKVQSSKENPPDNSDPKGLEPHSLRSSVRCGSPALTSRRIGCLSARRLDRSRRRPAHETQMTCRPNRTRPDGDAGQPGGRLSVWS